MCHVNNWICHIGYNDSSTLIICYTLRKMIRFLIASIDDLEVSLVIYIYFMSRVD